MGRIRWAFGVAQMNVATGQKELRVGAERGLISSEQVRWAKVWWITCRSDSRESWAFYQTLGLQTTEHPLQGSGFVPASWGG